MKLTTISSKYSEQQQQQHANNRNPEFDNELVSCRQLASYQLLLIGELMFIINARGRESFQNKISN